MGLERRKSREAYQRQRAVWRVAARGGEKERRHDDASRGLSLRGGARKVEGIRPHG
jgi:hypothetical protein